MDNTSVYNHQLFKDNFAKREVLCLSVCCAADDHGCVWRGELRDLEVSQSTTMDMFNSGDSINNSIGHKLAPPPPPPPTHPHTGILYTLTHMDSQIYALTRAHTHTHTQTHIELCEQVRIDCPHECGHACQRKVIPNHLLDCPNKPQLCPHCSVRFVLNKLEDHRPHCSKIKVPDSILSDITEVRQTERG